MKEHPSTTEKWERLTFDDYRDLPMFIRQKDYFDRETAVEQARRRRVVRTNAFSHMIIGGSLLGGGTAATVLAFFVSKGGFHVIVPSALVMLFGYRLITSGCQLYMETIRTYEDVATPT